MFQINILKSNKIKIVNLLLVSILVLSFFSIFISSDLSLNTKFLANPKLNSSGIKDSKITVQNYNSDLKNSDHIEINDWNEMIQKFDLNSNGISDQFENELSMSTFSDINENLLTSNIISTNIKEKKILNEKVSFIIQFPNYYDYNKEIDLFETNQGILKHTYKEAINGFAGNITYDKFNIFYQQLKESRIPFFIEENGYVESNLYYASRNMNIRPYVWNSLNFTGDNHSSIAILDTGIDVTHEYFDNYTSKNFSYKIVGWDDEVNIIPTTPHDDNGHGSHVAGIAAGVGTPVLDSSGRQVATSSLYEDFYPYAYIDGYIGFITLSRFNITTVGNIEIECNFTDYTLGVDRIYGRAILYYGGTQLDIVGDDSLNWEDNLTAIITPSSLGIYELALKITFDDLDNDGDPYVEDPLIRVRGEIHWPFSVPSFGCGNIWKGIAPSTHLVGVKVLGQDGSGDAADVLAGVNWVINNRDNDYNITVMSMSLGSKIISPSLITAINNAVENGIVTIIAAGNRGPGGNYIDSPGITDKAITVAAMNYKDQVTFYSSQGGQYYNTYKPDILAPGGSIYDLTIFSADTNDNDAEGNITPDNYKNDLMPAQGTSMATPAVAGAASLLIQAMGGGNQWDWNSGIKSKLVKSLLLMTATETYPLKREIYSQYSPTLERGGKDVHEGYGRINIDAAIRAWTNNLGRYKNISVWLNTSYDNSFGVHADAGYVDLLIGQNCMYNLTVPTGMDYDLYLYNNTPNQYGEPIIVASSTSASLGGNEFINYTATHSGRFFLVIKAIGKALPSVLEEEEDDDKTSEIESLSLIEFLTSPLGLIMILGVVAIIVTVIIITVKSSKKEKYDIDYLTRTTLE